MPINDNFIFVDCTDVLKLDELLNKDECTKIIKFLLESSLPWQGKHMEYLVVKSEIPGSGITSSLSCDLSMFPWKKLFKKSNLKNELIQSIMLLGGVITNNDISALIQKGENEDIDVLRLVLDECTPELKSVNLTSLCQQALNHKKLRFVDMLISKGAEPDVSDLADVVSIQDNMSQALNVITYLKLNPEGCTKLLLKAAEKAKYTLAEEWIQKESRELNQSIINLSMIISSKMSGNTREREEFVLFIKNLLQYGANPNGIGEICPLDAILEHPQLSKEYSAEKIQLLLILIEGGASIEHCTFPRKNRTTLLHIATVLAINRESGT